MLKPSDLDPKALRLQAARRARTALERDFIAREVERRMGERLDLIRLSPQLMVDIGCGRAAGRAELVSRYPQAAYLGIDLAPAALRHAKAGGSTPSALGRLGQWLGRTGVAIGARLGASVPRTPAPALFVAADTHRLPLAGNCTDLIWSNLAWHGFEDPLAVVAEWHRIIRPGGLAMFSAFGVDTLRELFGRAAGIVAFPDMHDIGDALVNAGFAEPVMDAERIRIGYRSAVDLLAEVRAALGGNPLAARTRALVSRAAYQGWLMALESRRGSDGLITVELEIIQGHAWCPARKRRPDGLVPVEFMSRRRPPD